MRRGRIKGIENNMWFEKYTEGYKGDNEMNGNEIDVVFKTNEFKKKDIKLLGFGKHSRISWLDSTIIFVEPETTFIDLLIKLGFFKSKQQAYKDGWRKYVPVGYTSRIRVGKLNNWEPITFLNIWNPRMYLYESS
jgi:hypothetical protein